MASSSTHASPTGTMDTAMVVFEPATGIGARSHRSTTLSAFGARVMRRLPTQPEENQNLHSYQRNLSRLVAERALSVAERVRNAASDGGMCPSHPAGGCACTPSQRGAAEFALHRTSVADLCPGSGKSFAIHQGSPSLRGVHVPTHARADATPPLAPVAGILLLPLALVSKSFPDGCGVAPTAGRHLVVFPNKSNVVSLLAEGADLDARCRRCARRGRRARDPNCDACSREVRASAARSNLCRKLGLSPEQAVEYARRIYVIPAGFDPANNPQQVRDFAEAWVVLCTVTKACRACNAGHFAERHFKALWMDEAHIGNDASEANRASNDATAAWWRLQTALCSSLVFAFTGTIARWMQPVIEGGGLLVRHTYGDQYRERKAAKLVVSTLCTSGLVLDGRTIGEEPLTDDDRVLLHTDERALRETAKVFLLSLLGQRQQTGMMLLGMVFANMNVSGATPIEALWRLVCRVAARLPACPVSGRRLRIAFVYTAVSSAADAEPFRDSDAVLSGFTNLDYDVLIVAQKGKLGYNNPLVKLILNLHCHSRTLESRNVQIQGVMRAIRILRLDDAWLRAVARRHGFWEAVVEYVTPLLERNEHQAATLLELDAHYETNQTNIRQWLAEQVDSKKKWV